MMASILFVQLSQNCCKFLVLFLVSQWMLRSTKPMEYVRTIENVCPSYQPCRTGSVQRVPILLSVERVLWLKSRVWEIARTPLCSSIVTRDVPVIIQTCPKTLLLAAEVKRAPRESSYYQYYYGYSIRVVLQTLALSIVEQRCIKRTYYIHPHCLVSFQCKKIIVDPLIRSKHIR